MRESEVFRIVSPGLNNLPGSISFESVLRPGYYIVNKNGNIDVDSLSNTGFDEVTFNNQCSWYARKDIFFNGFTSFESTIAPGQFIRHQNRRLKITNLQSQTDRSDASFLMNDAFTGSQASIVTESWKEFLGKTVSVESKSVPSYFWQTDSKEAFLQSNGEVFKLVEGLTGSPNTVSFESTSRPGYFLCRKGDKIIIVRMSQNNDQMRKDCTFVAWSDKFFDGYVSFEVSEQPGMWVRQENRQLQISTVETYRDNNDASFLLSETSFVPTTTTTTTTTTFTTTTTTRRRLPPIIEPCKDNFNKRIVKMKSHLWCIKLNKRLYFTIRLHRTSPLLFL